MIDSKRLDEIEAFALQFDGPFVVGYVDSADEGKELIRLARLGLWAAQHALPALRAVIDRYNQAQARQGSDLSKGITHGNFMVLDNALAALAKYGEK